MQTLPENIPQPKEDKARVVFLMGRMNPPTYGHIDLIKTMLQIGDFVVLSLTPGYSDQNWKEFKLHRFLDRPFSVVDREKMIRMRLSQAENARLLIDSKRKSVKTILSNQDDFPIPQFYRPSDHQKEIQNALVNSQVSVADYIQMVTDKPGIETMYVTAGDEYEDRATGRYDEHGNWIPNDSLEKRPYMGADQVVVLPRPKDGISATKIRQFLIDNIGERLTQEEYHELMDMFFAPDAAIDESTVVKFNQLISGMDEETQGLFEPLTQIMSDQNLSKDDLQTQFALYKKDKEDPIDPDPKTSQNVHRMIKLSQLFDQMNCHHISDAIIHLCQTTIKKWQKSRTICPKW